MKSLISIPKYLFVEEETNMEQNSYYNDSNLIDFNRQFQKDSMSRKQIHISNNNISFKRNIHAYDGGNIIAISTTSIVSIDTGIRINGFNNQTDRYIRYICKQQEELARKTADYLTEQQMRGKTKTADLRDKNTWKKMKRLVIRDELMKLQIGNKCDLPLTKEDLRKLKARIVHKDLSNSSDRELQKIINDILKPDSEKFLQALKSFKENGIVDPYFQKAKLQSLENALKTVDLDNITDKDLKHLMDNYMEKIEINHLTSLSKDVTKQSDINNLEVLNTTEHDKYHTRIDENGNKKIDYTKPVEGKPLDREADKRRLNQKRVRINELCGLGVTLLIAGTTAFAIGFVVQLAQNGLSPNSLKHAFVAGKQSAADTMLIAGISYVFLEKLSLKLATSIQNKLLERMKGKISTEIIGNLSGAISYAVGESLSLMLLLTYQFVKCKLNGFSTKESLLRCGRTAKIPIVTITMAAIAGMIWGDGVGKILSVSVGVIMVGTDIVIAIHDKNICKEISIYMIKLSEPTSFKIVESYAM